MCECENVVGGRAAEMTGCWGGEGEWSLRPPSCIRQGNRLSTKMGSLTGSSAPSLVDGSCLIPKALNHVPFSHNWVHSF